MHGDAPTENDTTLRATAFLGAALRLGATFRFGAALRFAGALRFGAAFFLPLVAEMVVVGAMDVAANLRWRSRVGIERRIQSFSVETVSTLQRTRPRAHRS